MNLFDMIIICVHKGRAYLFWISQKEWVISMLLYCIFAVHKYLQKMQKLPARRGSNPHLLRRRSRNFNMPVLTVIKRWHGI